MKKQLIIATVLTLLVIFIIKIFLTQKEHDDEPKGKLTITGSSSMQELCDDLATNFMKLHPNIEVVKSGLGSAEAVRAVQQNICQIGDLSRELNKDENPLNNKLENLEWVSSKENNNYGNHKKQHPYSGI